MKVIFGISWDPAQPRVPAEAPDPRRAPRRRSPGSDQPTIHVGRRIAVPQARPAQPPDAGALRRPRLAPRRARPPRVSPAARVRARPACARLPAIPATLQRRLAEVGPAALAQTPGDRRERAHSRQ